MSSKPIIVANPGELGSLVARRIVDAMIRAASGPFLLGCPTGRTPEPVFPQLAGLLAEANVDVSRLVVVLMDEYLDRDQRSFSLVDPALDYSCVGYAERFIVKPILDATGVAPQVWHAEPDDPANYDAQLREAGGIDLFLLASGASDGHVAFNPQGVGRDSITRVIELPELTRRDNVATWPTLDSIDQVPEWGISVGISTIVDLSREAIMMLTGTDKRRAYDRITSARAYEPDWPATCVNAIENHLVIADRLAAGKTE
ncbi:MAG: 6-phosphogluconolactonase [Propionibacteriaceae bacterium]|jgi:glucosamine-6-phosphate deaminase|nr:6-phosphogluconolactonase [Propionibacteriaceae bacterium]